MVVRLFKFCPVVVERLASVTGARLLLGAGVGCSALWRDCVRAWEALDCLIDSVRVGFAPVIGRSCDSLRLELDGRATLLCSKSCRATFCRLLDGVRLCDAAAADAGACALDKERRGEVGAAERVVVLGVR